MSRCLYSLTQWALGGAGLDLRSSSCKQASPQVCGGTSESHEAAHGFNRTGKVQLHQNSRGFSESIGSTQSNIWAFLCMSKVINWTILILAGAVDGEQSSVRLVQLHLLTGEIDVFICGEKLSLYGALSAITANTLFYRSIMDDLWIIDLCEQTAAFVVWYWTQGTSIGWTCWSDCTLITDLFPACLASDLRHEMSHYFWGCHWMGQVNRV